MQIQTSQKKWVRGDHYVSEATAKKFPNLTPTATERKGSMGYQKPTDDVAYIENRSQELEQQLNLIPKTIGTW